MNGLSDGAEVGEHPDDDDGAAGFGGWEMGGDGGDISGSADSVGPRKASRLDPPLTIPGSFPSILRLCPSRPYTYLPVYLPVRSSPRVTLAADWILPVNSFSPPGLVPALLLPTTSFWVLVEDGQYLDTTVVPPVTIDLDGEEQLRTEEESEVEEEEAEHEVFKSPRSSCLELADDHLVLAGSALLP